MKKLYRSRFEEFLKYAGEPSEQSIRNNIALVISIVYFILAMLIWIFQDSKIIIMLGYNKDSVRAIVICSLMGFSYIMMVCWLIILNKRLWYRKGEKVSENNCWWILKILFFSIFVLECVKDTFLYVLREPKQKVIINYISEISMAFLVSGCCMIIVIPLLTEGMVIGGSFIGIIPTLECLCLVIEITYIYLFFFLSKRFAYFSISLEVKHDIKRRLKKNRIRDMKQMLKRSEIKRQIEYRKAKKIEQFDLQFKQTRLLFYVVIVFLLLIMHIEESDIYGQLYRNQFMGIATLAALLREVENARYDKKIT